MSCEENPYILSCCKCGKMISNGNYQLDFCLNCGEDVRLKESSNYKKCDTCRKIFQIECNIYYCCSCGQELDPMDPKWVYCVCGTKNSSEQHYCYNCFNPIKKEIYLELYHDKLDTHYISGIEPGKWCSVCGKRQLPPTPVKSPKKFKKTCIVCMDNIATHAFMPCGHLCVCTVCSNIEYNNACPICRSKYISICKIYI